MFLRDVSLSPWTHFTGSQTKKKQLNKHNYQLTPNICRDRTGKQAYNRQTWQHTVVFPSFQRNLMCADLLTLFASLCLSEPNPGSLTSVDEYYYFVYFTWRSTTSYTPREREFNLKFNRLRYWDLCFLPQREASPHNEKVLTDLCSHSVSNTHVHFSNCIWRVSLSLWGVTASSIALIPLNSWFLTWNEAVRAHRHTHTHKHTHTHTHTRQHKTTQELTKARGARNKRRKKETLESPQKFPVCPLVGSPDFRRAHWPPRLSYLSLPEVCVCVCVWECVSVPDISDIVQLWVLRSL